MIYDMMYRDGANYKKCLRAEINTFPLNAGRGEIEMEESGLTMHEFFDHMGWEFCAELDHNKLEILGLSDDQTSEPEIRFVNDNQKHSEDIQRYDDDHCFAVDIPHVNRIHSGEWVNLAIFKTKEEAIKWAMENLGADENGMICVISSF